jgi:hypothetical protein
MKKSNKRTKLNNNSKGFNQNERKGVSITTIESIKTKIGSTPGIDIWDMMANNTKINTVILNGDANNIQYQNLSNSNVLTNSLTNTKSQISK